MRLETVYFARIAKAKNSEIPHYLTRGKWYRILEVKNSLYLICDDEGEKIHIHPLFCKHIHPGTWQIVSRELLSMNNGETNDEL